MTERQNDLSNFVHQHNIILTDKKTSEELIELIYEQYAPTSAFYIIDLGSVIKQYELWTELFPNIEPHYAVKANPNKIICQLLSILGTSFDVASVNEINLVKDLVSTTKMVYANPTKETTSISYARSVDCDLLVVDSVSELYKILLYHPSCNILLRIKVDDSNSLCKFSEKFGAAAEELEEIIKLGAFMSLNIIGVSWHVGSLCNDPTQFYKAFELAKYAFEVGLKYNLDFNVIDIGGGFISDRLLLEKTASEITKALETFFNDYDYTKQIELESESDEEINDKKYKKKQLRLISEPGRFFVSDSHTLVLNIIGKKVKKIDNETRFHYTLNDGIYNSFNCITYDHSKPVIIPYNNRETIKYKSTIFGCTCDSMDKICNDVMLPQLEVGDTCYVEKFGAYTVASSSKGFNGFTEIRKFYVLSK